MRKSQGYKRPYKVKRKGSIVKSRLFWFFVLGLAVILAVLYFLFFSGAFQVKNIIIIGERKILAESIELIIKENLKKKVLFFNTKSIFLINLEKTKQELLSSFPQIGQIEIRREFPDTVRVTVIEKKAVASFCQYEKCCLLDNQGIAFEEGVGQENLLEIVDQREIQESNLGQEVIEKNLLSLFLKVKQKLTDFNLNLDRVLLFEETATTQTNKNWEIYFDLKGDMDWQITELVLVLEKQIPPERRGDLEYVDLRFSRVYYKYR